MSEGGVFSEAVSPAFALLTPVHQSDYMRARVLDEFGGVYLDADTMGFASLVPWFGKLRRWELTGVSWPPDGDPIAVGVLGPFRAHSLLTQRWLAQLKRKLEGWLPELRKHKIDSRHPYPIPWAGILRDIVVPIMDDLIAKQEGHFLLPRRDSDLRAAELPWHHLGPPSQRRHIKPHPPTHRAPLPRQLHPPCRVPKPARRFAARRGLHPGRTGAGLLPPLPRRRL